MEKDVRPIIEVNLLGMIRVNNAFVDMIIESKGCLVNIGSIAGKLAIGGQGAIYTASKFGTTTLKVIL